MSRTGYMRRLGLSVLAALVALSILAGHGWAAKSRHKAANRNVSPPADSQGPATASLNDAKSVRQTNAESPRKSPPITARKRPRKLDLPGAQASLKVCAGTPQPLPGSGGALIAKVGDATAKHVHLMLYTADSVVHVDGRSYPERHIANVPRAKAGDVIPLSLPDEQYVIRVLQFVGQPSDKAWALIEIRRGLPAVRAAKQPPEGRVSDAEEAEIRRILSRVEAPEAESLMSSWGWFMIHTADEKNKRELLRVTVGLKDLDEAQEADLVATIRAAGGVARYRRQVAALLKNHDVSVRGYAAIWLALVGDRTCVSDLTALLRNSALPVAESVFAGSDREAAAIALGLLGASEYTRELATLLDDGNAHVRAGAAQGLAHFKAKGHAPAIAKLLDDEEAGPIFAALFALSELGARDHAGKIADLLGEELSKDVSIPDAALSALMRLNAREQVEKIAKHKSGTAAKALAVLGARQYAGQIAAMLKWGREPGEELARRDALFALGILGAKQYADEVASLMRDQEGYIRTAAAWSIILMEDCVHGAQAIRVLEDEYYGNPITLDSLDDVPREKCEQIAKRAEQSLSRLRKELARSERR
jgi:HEAT repeat protein